MVKNLKIERALALLLAIGMGLSQQGCSKTGVPDLNTSLQALSESKDPNFKVDDYLREMLEENGTSMSELERQLIDAYAARDKKKCNETLATILEAEIQALVAEGLGIPEDKMLEFVITGYTVTAPFTETGSLDQYAVFFEYNGHQYEFEGDTGVVRNALFAYRAAAQEQLDLDGSDNTIQAGYDVAKNLPQYSFYLIDEPDSLKLYDGQTQFSQYVTFDGRIAGKKSKAKRKAILEAANRALQ